MRLFLAPAAVCIVYAPVAPAQSIPNPDFRETAVIPSFQKRKPSVVNFRTFYRKDLDARHRLLVVLGGAPSQGWNAQRTNFWVGKGDLLGLFLADRGDPNLVWELGVFEIGQRGDLMWVDRADERSLVFGRVAGDYNLPTTYWKFLFDIPSKRLVDQWEYNPVAFAGFRERNGALLALGSGDEKPVEVALDQATPRLLRGARQGMWPAIPSAFPSSKGPPGDCRKLPRTDLFCLAVSAAEPEAILGIMERRTGRILRLPQTTLVDYAAARPENPNTVTEENIVEHFGPYQITDRFWFAKVFYDGEGLTGVGGIGYFDPQAAKYVIHSPPAIARWSASALLVEEDAVWVGLIGHPERGKYSGGLVRLDRRTQATDSYVIPDIVFAIARHGDSLWIGTANGFYRLHGGELSRHTVEPGVGGAYKLYEGMPVQTRSGLSYEEAVLEAAWRSGRKELHSEELLAQSPAVWRRILSHSGGFAPEKLLVALLRLLDDPPEQLREEELRRQAWHRLHELDPAKARERLVKEVRRLSPALDNQLVQLVPTGSVPPMDGALLAYYRRWRQRWTGGPSGDLLIARFLSPNARERVRAIYESLPEPCQPQLLAYFLRADPAYAERILRREPWEMHQPPGPCVMPYLSRVPSLYMSPLLEEYLIAYTWHEQVRVKWMAAASLGRVGSPRAQEALWKMFRYFHDYWKDRQSEMRANPEAGYLQERVRESIAHAANWVAGPEELERLGALCLGDRCLWANAADLAHWSGDALPAHLGVNAHGRIHGSLAQYRHLNGMEEVVRKLVQFKAGTVFKLSVTGDAAEPLRVTADQEFRDAAAQAGLLVR